MREWTNRLGRRAGHAKLAAFRWFSTDGIPSLFLKKPPNHKWRRRMSRFSVFAVLILATPALAQQNEAEKLLRAMEAKVRAAKSLEIAFEGDGASGAFKFKGKFLLGEGNRLRVEVEIDADKKKQRSLLICDGKTLLNREEGSGRDKILDTRADAAGRFCAFFTRGGVFEGARAFGDEAPTSPPKDSTPEERMSITDIKLGDKVKIGSKEAQVVHYHLTVFKNAANVRESESKMAVWIDTKTHLPLRREVEVKADKRTLTTVETYSTITLDAKMDAKVFELPK